MKYIRTKDGRISYLSCEPNEEITDYEIITSKGTLTYRRKDEVIKVADTIEELCDEFRVMDNDDYSTYEIDITCRDLKELYEVMQIQNQTLFGGIWTGKGFIYVAKMNEKGELELL